MSEANTNTQQIENNADWKADIQKVFEKLDNIIESKSQSVARSALRDNGFEDEEIKNIVKQWRDEKKSKNTENESKINELNTLVNSLNVQLRSEKVNNQAFVSGLELGLDAKTIPYVIKLADLSTVADEKGEISTENIKTALNKVLEDVPTLKPSATQTNGFVKIGADNTSGTSLSQEDILAGIFGTKKK